MVKKFYKKRFPKKYKKRMFKKKYRKFNKIPRPLGGFNETMSVKFKYSYLMDSFTTGTLSNLAFRLNSLFDPDYTGVGGLPLYLDLVSALYYNYKVNACAVKVFIINNHATERVYAGMYANNITSGHSDIRLIIEQGDKAKWCMLSTNGNKQNSRVMKSYYKIKSFFNNNIDDENFGALFTANPSLQLYLHLQMENTDHSTAIDVNYVVELTYYAKVYNKKPQSLS